MEEPQEKSDERKMYPAKCSVCGKDCEVPFEPIKDKPVKCRDCYKKGRPKNFGNQRFNKKMFDATCSKCGKNCQVPFKPNGKKPILCKECYMNSKQ